jgi:hypothetical protein
MLRNCFPLNGIHKYTRLLIVCLTVRMILNLCVYMCVVPCFLHSWLDWFYWVVVHMFSTRGSEMVQHFLLNHQWWGLCFHHRQWNVLYFLDAWLLCCWFMMTLIVSNYLCQNILKAMELSISPDRPRYWFLVKAIHGDVSYLHTEGHNICCREQHRTKWHGMDRVLSGDCFGSLQCWCCSSKYYSVAKIICQKTGYLVQRCNMVDGLFNPSVTLRVQFQSLRRVEAVAYPGTFFFFGGGGG